MEQQEVMLMKVLPIPEAPKRQINSFPWLTRLKSDSTFKFPKDKDTLFISNML
jgi:hypothetical protein